MMQEEAINDNETQVESFPDNLYDNLVPCPNCKDMVPVSLYCLNCGYPLHIFKQKEEGIDVDLRPDKDALAQVQDLTKNLINSISLKLWSVDLLKEGAIEEEHFKRLFGEYQARSVQCMGQRKTLLTHYSREFTTKARSLEPIEKALNEVKVKLRELETRRSIGDLHEGEYEAKAPTFRWEIQYYNEDIARRKEEMTFIEGLTRVIPTVEIEKIKEKVEDAQVAIDELLKKTIIGPETAAKVKISLEETRAFLDNFR
jgi:Skp family chaperone for outer membrane proteins